MSTSTRQSPKSKSFYSMASSVPPHLPLKPAVAQAFCQPRVVILWLFRTISCRQHNMDDDDDYLWSHSGWTGFDGSSQVMCRSTIQPYDIFRLLVRVRNTRLSNNGLGGQLGLRLGLGTTAGTTTTTPRRLRVLGQRRGWLVKPGHCRSRTSTTLTVQNDDDDQRSGSDGHGNTEDNDDDSSSCWTGTLSSTLDMNDVESSESDIVDSDNDYDNHNSGSDGHNSGTEDDDDQGESLFVPLPSTRGAFVRPPLRHPTTSQFSTTGRSTA
jgi:hypothetical protein